MTSESTEIAAELERIATAADEVAQEHRRSAADTRRVERLILRGDPPGDVMEQAAPAIASRLRGASRRSVGVTTRFLASAAQVLVSAGRTRREIAQHLGVSHQRVSALVHRLAHRHSDQL